MSNKKMDYLTSCKVNDEVYSVYDYDAYSIQELLAQYYDKINANAKLTNDLIEVIEHTGGIQGPQGDPGQTGPQGPIGQQGPAGPAGPQGVAGPQGPTGERGPKGEQGPAGARGEQGPEGKVGPGIQFKGEVTNKDALDQIVQSHTAKVGDSYYNKEDQHIYVYTDQNGGKFVDVGAIRGVQGPAGPAGPAGGQGPIGAAGPAGPKGDKGEKGDPGVAGPQGSVGPAGPAGDRGPQGPQGDPGQGVPHYTTAENGKVLGVNDGITKWISMSGADSRTVIYRDDAYNASAVQRWQKEGASGTWSMMYNKLLYNPFSTSKFKMNDYVLFYGKTSDTKKYYTGIFRITGADGDGPMGKYINVFLESDSGSAGGSTKTLELSPNKKNTSWCISALKGTTGDSLPLYDADMTEESKKVFKELNVGDTINVFIRELTDNKDLSFLIIDYKIASKTPDRQFYVIKAVNPQVKGGFINKKVPESGGGDSNVLILRAYPDRIDAFKARYFRNQVSKSNIEYDKSYFASSEEAKKIKPGNVVITYGNTSDEGHIPFMFILKVDRLSGSGSSFYVTVESAFLDEPASGGDGMENIYISLDGLNITSQTRKTFLKNGANIYTMSPEQTVGSLDLTVTFPGLNAKIRQLESDPKEKHRKVIINILDTTNNVIYKFLWDGYFRSGGQKHWGYFVNMIDLNSLL